MREIENPRSLKLVFRIDGCDVLDETGKTLASQRGYLCEQVDEMSYVSATGDYEDPEISMSRSEDHSPIWKLKYPAHHKIIASHDGIYLLSFDLHVYAGRRTKFDTILKISPEGEILNKWSTYDHFSHLRKVLKDLTSEFENKIEGGFYEYTHFNSFVVRGNSGGDEELIVSSRNQSSLLSISLKTGEVRLIEKFERIEGIHSLNLVGSKLIFFGNIIKGDRSSDEPTASGVVYYDLVERKIERIISKFENMTALSETRGSVFPSPNSGNLLVSFSDGLIILYSPEEDRILYKARVEIQNASRKPLEKVYEVSLDTRF